MAIFNKTKAVGSNIANRIGQGLNSAEFESRMSTQRGLKNKYLGQASEIAYQLYLDDKKTFSQELTDLLEQAKKCDEEIARLEKEKADNIANKSAQRRTNMEEAYAADEETERARAEKK